MKKYRNLLLLIPFLVLFSCMEDESEYSSQEKENVQVDQVTVDTTDTDEELPEGQLVPGLHLVKLKVLQGQDSVERQFKYYMPVSTDASKPISLLFEFHGSYEFEAGEEVPNPISGISETHVLNQKAIKENYIICYPAGWPEFQQDSSGAVNWYVTSRSKDTALNTERGEKGTLLASGFIAGGALMGVVSAAMRFGGINLVNEAWLNNTWSEVLALGAYALLILYFIKASMKVK